MCDLRHIVMGDEGMASGPRPSWTPASKWPKMSGHP
jgi:hypothetical protein